MKQLVLHCCRQSQPKENGVQSEAPGALSSRGKGLLGAFSSSYYVSIAATPMQMSVCANLVQRSRSKIVSYA